MMSKQTSIFQFKGFKRFKRTILHQGQVVDISSQPPQKKNLLKCSYCDETFKSAQGLSIHVKCKHAHDYVKEMNTDSSHKIVFKKVEKQDSFYNFEVKELLEKLVDAVVKAETEVVEIVDEKNKLAVSKRKGIVPLML